MMANRYSTHRDFLQSPARWHAAHHLTLGAEPPLALLAYFTADFEAVSD